MTGKCAKCGESLKLGTDGSCASCGNEICWKCWLENKHKCPICNPKEAKVIDIQKLIEELSAFNYPAQPEISEQCVIHGEEVGVVIAALKAAEALRLYLEKVKTDDHVESYWFTVDEAIQSYAKEVSRG